MPTTNYSSRPIWHASRAARAVLVALATVGLLATTVAAHVRARQTFDIPFAFVVGATQCPPGTYTVKTSSDGVMAIVSADNATKVLFLGQLEQCQKSDEASLLVFNRYGDTRYLSQIRPSNETSFLKLHRSSEEATMARQWAERQETVAAVTAKKP